MTNARFRSGSPFGHFKNCPPEKKWFYDLAIFRLIEKLFDVVAGFGESLLKICSDIDILFGNLALFVILNTLSFLKNYWRANLAFKILRHGNLYLDGWFSNEKTTNFIKMHLCWSRWRHAYLKSFSILKQKPTRLF